MLTPSAPYTQRIKVDNTTIEETYETVKRWLGYNHCKITKENQPTDIDAYYDAEIPIFSIGPRDTLPKEIQVRVSDFGGDTLVYLTITQSLQGKGSGGYVFWGLRLLNLYGMLHVKITNSIWRELFPEATIRQIISQRTKVIGGFFLVSLALIWYFWNPATDNIGLYIVGVMIPAMLLLLWDRQSYTRLLKRPT